MLIKRLQSWQSKSLELLYDSQRRESRHNSLQRNIPRFRYGSSYSQSSQLKFCLSSFTALVISTSWGQKTEKLFLLSKLSWDIIRTMNNITRGRLENWTGSLFSIDSSHVICSAEKRFWYVLTWNVKEAVQDHDSALIALQLMSIISPAGRAEYFLGGKALEFNLSMSCWVLT